MSTRRQPLPLPSSLSSAARVQPATSSSSARRRRRHFQPATSHHPLDVTPLERYTPPSTSPPPASPVPAPRVPLDPSENLQVGSTSRCPRRRLFAPRARSLGLQRSQQQAPITGVSQHAAYSQFCSPSASPTSRQVRLQLPIGVPNPFRPLVLLPVSSTRRAAAAPGAHARPTIRHRQMVHRHRHTEL